jgi:DNA invertase Pin-like site-specific DNA recombinase
VKLPTGIGGHPQHSAGRFTHLYAEALDRLSRDQEDVAGLFKRLRHVDVTLITLSEGEISELHVGLKGTMNALFLKDLADKVRRGQRGRVGAGAFEQGAWAVGLGQHRGQQVRRLDVRVVARHGGAAGARRATPDSMG